jgi:sugar lactone lactonase YvrE
MHYLLRWLIALALAAATGIVILVTMFPTHWRVAAAEQWLLAPWLRPAYLGDGGPASKLLLCYPMGMAVNGAGELLISDRGRERRGRVVWRIDRDGIAHIFAGSGRRGEARAMAALQLSFDRPEGLAVAGDGSVFISDGFNHAVYRIDADGRATRFAGTGSPGFSGDGGMAAEARFFRPADLRLDSKGNLFIADVRNHRVRRVDPSGRISTVAGTGEPGFSPDGTPAEHARLDTPWGLLVDHEDRLIIADSNNHRVRRVEMDGRLVTIAGNGRQGFDGDGGPATGASLNTPEGLFEDEQGRLFIGDELNHAVRRVDANGVISTLIGIGVPGRAVIGAPARGSALDDPENVVVTAAGEVIITDGNNGRILRIGDDGVVRNFAGRGDIGRCATRW